MQFGHLAEVAWHHPDLVVSYAFVEVKLMTHATKGISQLDFDLAKKIDDFIFWDPKEDNSPLEGTPEDPRFAYVKKKINLQKIVFFVQTLKLVIKIL